MDNANDDEFVTSAENTRRSSWLNCISQSYKIILSVSVFLLAAIVVLLGLQVQSLKSQLTAEDAKIDALQTEVTQQQNNQEDLTDRVEQEHSLTLYQMAGTFTLLTCLFTAFHITQHLQNFNEPVVQRKIIAILWMSPIYSVTSFLSLIFPSADGYLAVLKDFYEAYVIYTFLSFLIAVLGRGNRDAAVTVLAAHADHLKAPTKCLTSCYHPPPETSATAKASAVLMECQILAMQFVLVRPVTSILWFVCDTYIDDDAQVDDDEDPYAYFKSPNFYIAMITNVSVFFAFNGLLKFYHVVQQDLQWCKPFSKFMSIKGIVFLTFWQGLLIAIIVNFEFNGGTSYYSPGGGVSANKTSPVAAPVPAPVATFAPAPVGTIVATPAPTSFEGATIDHSGDNGDDGNLRFLLFDDADIDDDATSRERAAQIQNFLICLEMLFFSLAHYCVFPAEEWEPDYRPKQHYAKPGIGLKDFASDIGFIMSSSSSARAYRRNNSSKDGDESLSANGSSDDVDVLQTVEEISDDDGVVVVAESISQIT